MDVVLYQEALYSFGERQHAASFATQAREAGYRPRFVVAKGIAEETRRAGFDPIVFDRPERGIDAVRELAPPLIVGCELFNLGAETIEALAHLGPLATIDGTSLGHAIRTDPFARPEFRKTLTLPDGFLSLRACPVHDVDADTPGVFHWPLFAESKRLGKDPGRYASLGLDPARKTVLLAVAPWAQHFAEHFAASGDEGFAGIGDYYERLFSRLLAGLSDSGESCQLVVVARNAPARRRRGDAELCPLGLLHYDDFDHLSRSCDLVVSDNLIQASLVRAFVMGIPQLAIRNSGCAELSSPFNIFPLRQRLPGERAFARSVATAEFGDPAEIRDKLAALLRSDGEEPGGTEPGGAYRTRLRAMPGAGDVLSRILGPARPGS